MLWPPRLCCPQPMADAPQRPICSFSLADMGSSTIGCLIRWQRQGRPGLALATTELMMAFAILPLQLELACVSMSVDIQVHVGLYPNSSLNNPTCGMHNFIGGRFPSPGSSLPRQGLLIATEPPMPLWCCPQTLAGASQHSTTLPRAALGPKLLPWTPSLRAGTRARSSLNP